MCGYRNRSVSPGAFCILSYVIGNVFLYLLDPKLLLTHHFNSLSCYCLRAICRDSRRVVQPYRDETSVVIVLTATSVLLNTE